MYVYEVKKLKKTVQYSQNKSMTNENEDLVTLEQRHNVTEKRTERLTPRDGMHK